MIGSEQQVHESASSVSILDNTIVLSMDWLADERCRCADVAANLRFLMREARIFHRVKPMPSFYKKQSDEYRKGIWAIDPTERVYSTRHCFIEIVYSNLFFELNRFGNRDSIAPLWLLLPPHTYKLPSLGHALVAICDMIDLTTFLHDLFFLHSFNWWGLLVTHYREGTQSHFIRSKRENDAKPDLAICLIRFAANGIYRVRSL